MSSIGNGYRQAGQQHRARAFSGYAAKIWLLALSIPHPKGQLAAMP
jgi:hypothetical protein